MPSGIQVQIKDMLNREDGKIKYAKVGDNVECSLTLLNNNESSALRYINHYNI